MNPFERVDLESTQTCQSLDHHHVCLVFLMSCSSHSQAVRSPSRNATCKKGEGGIYDDGMLTAASSSRCGGFDWCLQQLLK